MVPFLSGAVVQTGIIRVFEVVSSSASCNAHVRIVRCASFTIMALSGAVISLRAGCGPLTFPLKVTNPVNPEDWFALALVLTMLVTADAAENTVTNYRATI